MTHGPMTLPKTLLVAAALAAGAAAVEPLAAQEPASAPGGGEVGSILVLSASSLTDVLPRITAAFEAHGGASVRHSFDATSRLAAQVHGGAPADVLISADDVWVEWLRERDLVRGEPLAVARNELVLVLPVSRPRDDIRSATDLLKLERVAIGGENVPVGRYARAALERAGVGDAVGHRLITAGSARSVLEWVARGEVDAGVVYRTDAMVEPRVTTAFTFGDEAAGPVVYQAVVIATSAKQREAAAFVDYLAGAESQAMLRNAGFRVGGPSDRSRAMESPSPGLPSIGSAIRLSLLVALLATALGFVPAVALGWLLARRDFPGKSLVSTLVLAPLVMPPVVTGFLLLSLLGRESVLGSLLASVGLSVPFTIVGATLAALIVGLPLYVLSVRGAFEAVDPLYEELSWTLGKQPRTTFFQVSLPLAMPGIAAGAILAFARALGEFGATVVLAGNVEGSTRTIALAVYTLLEAPGGREATWLLVAASVVLSLLALVGFEALNRRQRRRLREDHGG